MISTNEKRFKLTARIQKGKVIYMNNRNETKKRLGALDIFIILALAACIISVGIRYFTSNTASADSSAALENYILSFDVYNIRNSSGQNFMEPGTNFYLDENDEYFGTLREQVTIRDAQRFYTTHNGDVILVSNTGTGDSYRIDVEGKMTCRGTMNENGSFLLNGNHYVALDKEIKIYSKYLVVTVKITGITAE